MSAFPEAPVLEPEAEPQRPDAEVDSTLARAAALRFPNLTELHGREKVERLVDYITETAIARGELEELRLETHISLLDLQKRWLAIDVPANKTQAQADAARRLRNPVLAEQVETARWLIARCTEQISRLGGTDYDAASRAYTLLGG